MASLGSDGALMGAAGIVGLAVWQLSQAYCGMAPDLSELRNSDSDGTEMRQRVLDADWCVGGLAVIAGGAAAWLADSVVPLGLVLAALIWISYCHRAVLKGATPNQIDGGK
jgi:hypothetical protein